MPAEKQNFGPPGSLLVKFVFAPLTLTYLVLRRCASAKYPEALIMKFRDRIERELHRFDKLKEQPISTKIYSIMKPEFLTLELGGLGLQYLLDRYQFNTVLDIGCGAGMHSEIMDKYGKTVTAIDLGRSVYYRKKNSNLKVINADFQTFKFNEKFDCIWASHVLEHQVNILQFLDKLKELLVDNGILAVTVPPNKSEIVGGHVTTWSPGLLLYNLIIAGFDCSQAFIFKYGYNITVILRKKIIELPELDRDNGDIDRLARFFPVTVNEGFDGSMDELLKKNNSTIIDYYAGVSSS